ncbi:MAG: hypothetical protein FWF15_06880 [Oscillospiraceae bacterium]|nr:hypothetical protein [Oscillospiraceae bacterium]
MKKFIALLLVLSCVITIFACAGDNPANKVPDPKSTESEAETTEARPDIPIVDMEGKEIRIFATGWYSYLPLFVVDIAPDEFSGESLNDVAYERKLNIENMYNCKIFQTTVDVPDQAVAAFQKSIQAGDDEYEIGIIRGMTFSNMLTGGYLRELDDLNNVDFDNPWWRKKASEALAIGNKNFGVCGDISSNEMVTVLIVCFNKNMVTDYALEVPYDLVKSGKWTLDKIVEMAKVVARDIDGDNVMTGADIWGIIYAHDQIAGILNTCGISLARLDNEGYPEITFDTAVNLSKIQTIFEKLFDETYSGNTTERITSPDSIFGNERSLFIYTSTHASSVLRQDEVDLGIVPYPKYDETQEDYLPYPTSTFLPIFCIPATNNDMDNTGLFMEAFAYEGRKSVIPVFYETVLKGKVARDNTSEEMIDYIFGNISYDTGTILNFGNMAVYIQLMSLTLDTNIASFAAKNRPAYETAIQKIMDEIDAR